ncbi:ribonuclease III [Aspergillus foveolatus]|uniref:ribonuclease III n=1 Tax=Aspergillus foveolatus TaxID=210207 RepID=UPI003CCDA236
MDRKRKSVFASYHDDNVARTRVKKHHDYSPIKASSQMPLPDSDFQNDIQTICMLVNKITTVSESRGVKPSSEIFEAAKRFTLALQKTSLLSNTTTNLNGNDADVSSRPIPCHTRRVPPLPPIKDDQLERAVFTHPGVAKDPRTTYDRLEILGDAYIELISTKLIWNKFQHIPSGRISQIRELLVKNETLAEYATQYGIDKKASVPAELYNQPKRWIKTKGDIFEAYVAALILSHPDGYSVAETWLSELWSPKLDSFEESCSTFQAKEALARKINGKGAKLRYIDEKESVQHQGGTQTFFIGVYFTGWGWNNKHLGSGQGSNKTIAGDRAAQQALENTELIQEIVASKSTHGTGTL